MRRVYNFAMRAVVAFVLLTVMSWFANRAKAVPLDSWPTWNTDQPYVAKQVPPNALVARGIGTDTYYVLEVDPVTGELPVQISTGVALASEGPIADPVPTYGIQIAGKDGNGDLTAVHVDTDGDVQVDVLSSALPSGAATAAKQPALGTAGTASADVITVQGIASMTPIQVADNGGALTVDGTVEASNLPATVDTDSGAAGASTIRVVPATRSEAAATPLSVRKGNGTSFDSYDAGSSASTVPRVVNASAPLTSAIVLSNAYASTNVTTAAYVELTASTANAVNTICISDSSGSIIKVATGAAASEVDRIYLPGGGSGCFNINIPASTRIALRAIDASATSGYFLFTAY